MSDGRVQAAVVVALVTLSVALLGEMFVRVRERRVRRESATTVYRKYADPLAAASTALFYRLREIFDERGGGFYLQNHEHVVRYEHYKAISTLYRLAAFLGWVQGLKRELFFVPRTRDEMRAWSGNCAAWNRPWPTATGSKKSDWNLCSGSRASPRQRVNPRLPSWRPSSTSGST